jgi:hypothetical protein
MLQRGRATMGSFRRRSAMRRPRLAVALLLCLLVVFGCVDPQSEASRSITAPDGSAKSLSDGCATASDRFFSYYGYYSSGISCTWTGSGWSISVSFYWSGYDSYQTWYYWLGDNNYSIEQAAATLCWTISSQATATRCTTAAPSSPPVMSSRGTDTRNSYARRT